MQTNSYTWQHWEKDAPCFGMKWTQVDFSPHLLLREFGLMCSC